MIYILGINGFIARNFYLELKKQKRDITCLSHDDLYILPKISNDDIVINFCGANRGNSIDDYYKVNYKFVKKIIKNFKRNGTDPYFVHISSLMVNGFLNKTTKDLPEHQQNFINSKLKGEKYLVENYPNSKLCIIRPSNIYGYDCEPYYNNILVTLINEKIKKNHKINKINKNCIRNFLSIDGLCYEMQKLIDDKLYGIFNIVSNNSINLDLLVNLIYDNQIPNEISIDNGEETISKIDSDIPVVLIVHNENLSDMIKLIETKMGIYINLCQKVEIKILNRLSQPRGDMVEITDLNSNRLYMITLNDHSTRGNHYHYQQIEHFYQYEGKVIFLLADKEYPDIIFFKIINKNSLVTVNPLIIHTVVNDFINNKCELIVSSTQAFIANKIPDTEYTTII